jgi:FKBP-type peptidyl-prolyl cis-trans isomerase
MLLLSPERLQIKDVTVGKGPAAKEFDVVTVDYTGTLTNGKQFDSSVGRKPFTFILGAGQVIKGWDQGVAGMKAGGKRLLTIPAELAYGSRSMGDIPANSTLKFEVTLHKIERVKVSTLSQGKGHGAKPGDRLELHYRGTFEDGKAFDSSYDRNQPIALDLGRTGMIPGFTQGLIGIKVGEKRKIVIPPSLGYGEQGRPPVIPANSTLVFEVELLNNFTAK